MSMKIDVVDRQTDKDDSDVTRHSVCGRDKTNHMVVILNRTPQGWDGEKGRGYL